MVKPLAPSFFFQYKYDSLLYAAKRRNLNVTQWREIIFEGNMSFRYTKEILMKRIFIKNVKTQLHNVKTGVLERISTNCVSTIAWGVGTICSTDVEMTWPKIKYSARVTKVASLTLIGEYVTWYFYFSMKKHIIQCGP